MISPLAWIQRLGASSRRTKASGVQEVTHIRAGTELRGTIHAEAGSAVVVSGVQHGDIIGAQIVYVTAGGKVDGSVHAQEVIVAGEVDGEVHAAQRVEVQATGVIVGLVYTRAALCLDGARLNGTVRIGEPVRLAARSGVRTVVSAGPAASTGSTGVSPGFSTSYPSGAPQVPLASSIALPLSPPTGSGATASLRATPRGGGRRGNVAVALVQPELVPAEEPIAAPVTPTPVTPIRPDLKATADDTAMQIQRSYRMPL